MSSIGFVPQKINSEEDLITLLNKFPDIDTHRWVKEVSALYKEIQNNECTLGIEDGKLHRRVDVVAIRCFYTNEEGQHFQLMEEKQVFENGRVRERGHKYVAEKLQTGETPEHGAIRGLAEELHISGSDVHVTPLPECSSFEKCESPTYPGIQCSYHTYVFSCEITREHYRDSYIEEQADKKTYFKWVRI